MTNDQWELKAADALTRRGRIIFKGDTAALDASKFFGACKESNGEWNTHEVTAGAGSKTRLFFNADECLAARRRKLALRRARAAWLAIHPGSTVETLIGPMELATSGRSIFKATFDGQTRRTIGAWNDINLNLLGKTAPACPEDIPSDMSFVGGDKGVNNGANRRGRSGERGARANSPRR